MFSLPAPRYNRHCPKNRTGGYVGYVGKGLEMVAGGGRWAAAGVVNNSPPTKLASFLQPSPLILSPALYNLHNLTL